MEYNIFNRWSLLTFASSGLISTVMYVLLTFIARFVPMHEESYEGMKIFAKFCITYTVLAGITIIAVIIFLIKERKLNFRIKNTTLIAITQNFVFKAIILIFACIELFVMSVITIAVYIFNFS